MPENLPTHKGPFAYRAEVLAVAWATVKREILTPGYVKRTVATAIVITFGSAAFWGMGEFLNYLWGAVAACGLFSVVLLLALVWELFVTPSKLRNDMVGQVRGMAATIDAIGADDPGRKRKAEFLATLQRETENGTYIRNQLHTAAFVSQPSDERMAILANGLNEWRARTADAIRGFSPEAGRQFLEIPDALKDRLSIDPHSGPWLHDLAAISVDRLGSYKDFDPAPAISPATPQGLPDPTRSQ